MAKHLTDNNWQQITGGVPSGGTPAEGDNPVLSATVSRIEKLTQAQYDGLTAEQKADESVIYAIKSA